MNVHKVTLMIIDFDEIGQEDIKITLENTIYPNHCFDGMSVMNIESKDIGEWYDEHPLNYKNKKEEAFKELFK